MVNETYWEELPKIQQELKEKIDKDNWRLHWHQMPVTGWLNDPNGSCQFDGTYHLYHQYVPETPNGGATHWGHKTSTDLVHFSEEEIFLSPDETFNQDGVYSGTAFEYEGKLHFFYTGNVKHEGDHDYTFSGREQNTVHVVSSDGFNIEKHEVVIPHEEYPEGFTDHIRDPKVFQHQDTFYMILGGRKRSNTGAILLYKSKNLNDWEYAGNFIEGNENQGYMWECPDYFQIDGKDIMVFSPQGILPTKYYYQSPHAVIYQLGTVDWDHEQFLPDSPFIELDHGFDFYAPQTFEDDKGRRILWAWMGIGDTSPEYTNPTVVRGWQHAMAMPRELVLSDGRIHQRPLEEYQVLRAEEKKVSLSDLDQTILKGESYELYIQFDTIATDFKIDLRQDTQLIYRDNEFTFIHGESGYGRRSRTIPVASLKDIRIFSDTSSMEIFINDGADTLTTRLYPEPGADKIEYQGDKAGQIHFWQLKY